MDCDDFQLLMATPGESEELRSHLLECEDCRTLAIHLQTDDLPPHEASAPCDELIGTVIGAYEILELVGSGGMGRVYLAVHPTIGSRVAIKVFSKDWNEHPALVARFFAEAHATNLIAHENIVNVLDLGRLDDERPYLIMEYLLGAPLSKLVGTEALNDAALTQIMLDVLGALSAAHAHEIVHRDLKPDNIFVSPEGRATLLDFGIAKLIPEIGDAAPTATGTILGTPHYMSPEQAVGDPVDTRTDVYAMGVILYECFTGRRPFTGFSLYRLMDQHVNRVPPPPSSVRPDIGPDVEAIILKALAKSPEDRFATTSEMRNALEQCNSDTASGAFMHKGPATDFSESVQSETAETVANRPTVKGARSESPAAWRPLRWVASSLLIAGLSTGIFLWARGDNAARDVKADATSSLEAASSLASIPIPDASIGLVAEVAPIDASDPNHAGPIRRRKPIRNKVVGTAPLSLLSAATQLAQARVGDVVLTRIRLYKPNRSGRVEIDVPGKEIQFDFLSPRMASRVAERGRKVGTCIVRVAYHSASKGEVATVSAKCAALRPLTKPPCSVATMMKAAMKSGDLPAQGVVRTALLQVSQSLNSPRSYWKFELDNRDYKTPSCG